MHIYLLYINILYIITYIYTYVTMHNNSYEAYEAKATDRK